MFIAFFFSCWFPQSNLELWFRGHAVPDDLPHLLIFFFTFAKFIPRLACEFVECFQCAFGFFSALNISEDVVNRFLWNLFFSYFLSLFFTQRFISKNGRSKGGESKMIYCIVSICLASMDQTFSPASITNNGFVWQIWSASNCTNLRLILCTEIPSQTDERTINLVSKSWCCWWYKEEMRENVIR